VEKCSKLKCLIKEFKSMKMARNIFLNENELHSWTIHIIVDIISAFINENNSFHGHRSSASYLSDQLNEKQFYFIFQIIMLQSINMLIAKYAFLSKPYGNFNSVIYIYRKLLTKMKVLLANKGCVIFPC
jgi:hypothetical protein